MNRNSKAALRSAAIGGSQSGVVLVLLLPILSLWFAGLGVALMAVRGAHFRVAHQSRLDICTLRSLMARRKAIQSLVETNKVLDTTAKAVMAIRLGRLVTGPFGQVATTLGEGGLKALNQAARARQESLILSDSLTLISVCGVFPMSRSPVACHKSPAIRISVKRNPSLVEGMHGPLTWIRPPKTIFRCGDFRAIAVRSLQHEPSLKIAQFTEAYEK